MHVYGHRRGGYVLEGYGIRTHGEGLVCAQPAARVDRRSGCLDVVDVARGVLEEPRPACSDQNYVACVYLRTQRTLEMLRRDYEVRRERIHALGTRYIEQHCTAHDRL